MASNLSHGMKRVLSGIMALLIVAGGSGLSANVRGGGLFARSAITANAETYSSHVMELQVGDILEPGAMYDANGKTIILQAGGYCTGGGQGDNVTYTQGTQDVIPENLMMLRVSSENDTLGAIGDMPNSYYPYANGAKVDAWQVVSVQSDGDGPESNQTITLTGYAETQSDNLFTSAVYYRQYNSSGELQDNGTLAENAGILIESDTKKWADGNTYVASGTVTIDSRVKVTGTVNLILLDGASLTINGGISVAQSAPYDENAGTLNIFAGSTTSGTITDSGSLTATGSDWNAGIGCSSSDFSSGNVNIHGGTITATGGKKCAGIGGTVNIYDGTVTANGGDDGAGIGGNYNHDGNTVNIYGGTVNAAGGENGAGIGGGQCGDGGTVNILGGTVIATAGDKSEWDDNAKIGVGIGGGGYYDDMTSNGTLTVADNATVYTSTDNDTWTDTTNSLDTRTRYMRVEPAAAVTYTYYPAVAATCTDAGNIEYYLGSDNKYYSNDQGTLLADQSGDNVVDENDVVIAATGHSYGTPTYSWTEESGVWKCTATRTCANNASHVETETVDGIYAEVTPATVNTVGTGRWTATFTNNAFTAQTKDVEIAKLVPEKHDAVAPTCTAAGNIEYYIYDGYYYTKSDGIFIPLTDRNDDGEVSADDVVIPALGHEFTYQASDNVLTATCTHNCDEYGEGVQLTIAPLDDLTYNGSAKGAALSGLEAFNTVTGLSVFAENIVYEQLIDEEYQDINYIPANAGSYRASLIVEGQTISVTYYIAKADLVENTNYTVPTDLTATYGQTLADVELPERWAWDDALDTLVGDVGEHTFSATFTPEDDSNYNTVTIEVTVTVGKADPDYTIPSELTAIYGQTLEDVELPAGWAWDDNTQSVGNAGTNVFKATFTPNDTANYNTVENIDVNLTVNKAASSCTVPVAKSALVYSGDPQALVFASTPTGGTMRYSLDGVNWSTDIPTGINAGDYTVYYKVVGDDNHNDTVEASVPVSIAKATNPLTVLISDWTYGDTANSPSVMGAYTTGVTYQYAVKGTDAWSNDVPTDAKTYTVKATVAESANYLEDTATCDFVIEAKSLANAIILLDKTNFAVEDSPYKPNVRFVILDGKILEANTDYTVSYENYEDVSENTPTVIITGKENYRLTATKAFTIGTNLSEAVVSVSGTYTYNGEAKTPNVTVTYKGVEVDSDNYTIAYSNNTNSGTATVTIIGVNSNGYTGSASTEFTIEKAALDAVAVNGTFSYTGEGISPTDVVVTLAGGAEVDSANYDVTFRNNVNAGTALVIVTAKKGTNYTGTADGTFVIDHAYTAVAEV
ncbi:hypothetical protein SAMN02910280_0375, partial [Ruminococcus flavefaciens]